MVVKKQTFLRINLNTTAQTNKAIQILEQHCATLNQFHIQGFKNRARNNGDTTIIQQNLNNFLKILVDKAFHGPFNTSRYFTFDGHMLIDEKEAKLLTQYIKQTHYSYADLKLDCEVSQVGFEFLVTDCCANEKGSKNKVKRQRISFGGKGIKNSHIKCLDRLLISSSINFLNFKDTQLMDESAIALANALCQTNSTLLSLDLCDSKIGFEGAQALANMLCKNTCLESLDLSRNINIGDVGVVELAKSLQINSTLCNLRLSSVGCGNKGLLGLAEALTENKVLKLLYLNGNKFDEDDLEGIQALGKSLKMNSTLLDLSMGGILSDGDDGLLIATLVNAMDGKTSQIEVDLDSYFAVQFTEDTMELLTHCIAPLLSLGLACNNLQPNHIHIMSEAIRNDIFNIQGLSLENSQLDDDCIIDLFNVLIEKKNSFALIELSLDYVSGITQVGAHHIINSLSSTKLQRLHLVSIPIGDNGVQQLATILNDTQLAELSLDTVGMGDSGLMALSNALKSNTKLTFLDIYRDSNVTNVGKKALVETLKDYNRTLSDVLIKDESDNDTLRNQIKFYARLNTTKRDILCDPDLIPLGLFPYILEDHCIYPSVIYWILQNCPHVYRKN